MSEEFLLDRFRGALLGLACGDAVGTTVEFRQRGTFETVTDMTGGGPFRLKAGEWTDDTSMALCLASSLVEQRAFDAHDQMTRYLRWMRAGYLSSNGRCFDVGTTVLRALTRFEQSGEPFSGSINPDSAGNGCLMRLVPVILFFFHDRETTIRMAGESSRTTHGAQECIEACRLFGAILQLALMGQAKDETLLAHGLDDLESPGIKAIAEGTYRNKDASEVRGSGYVVESLEAALWSFYRTDNFRDAILAATNLGEDADTTAAICGQLAGAYYGERGIPEAWLKRLAMVDDIRVIAEQMLRCAKELETRQNH
jgi:ADP-ribosyl-[dinitrogen reductase] hydrolase